MYTSSEYRSCIVTTVCIMYTSVQVMHCNYSMYHDKQNRNWSHRDHSHLFYLHKLNFAIGMSSIDIKLGQRKGPPGITKKGVCAHIYFKMETQNCCFAPPTRRKSQL
jgi:hypothetical protein